VNHVCNKEAVINDLKTETAVTKQYIVIFDREIMELRKQHKANVALIITNLILIIGILLEKVL